MGENSYYETESKRRIKLSNIFGLDFSKTYKKANRNEKLGLVDRIKKLGEEEKIEAIAKYKVDLAPIEIAEIIETLSQVKKFQALEIYIKDLKNYGIAKVIKSLNESEKIEALDKYKDELTIDDIVEIVRELNENNRITILKKYKEELTPKGIAEIIKGLSESEKIKALKEYKEELTPKGVAEIIKGLSESEKIKLLEEYKEELTADGILEIIVGLNESEKIKSLEKYKKELKSDGIVAIIKGLSENEKIKALEKYKEEIRDEDIAEIIKGLNEITRMKALGISEIKQYLTNIQFGEILATFDTSNEEIDKYINEFIINQGFEKNELSLRIFKKLGIRVFLNNENSELLTEKSKIIFGEEELYLLCKYFVYTGEELNVADIIQKPETFEKYREFREKFNQKKQVPSMDTRDAIIEFSKNGNLITECMQKDLTEMELKLFKATLKEDKIIITNKEDLSKFPQKRKEHIDELINIDKEQALIYILTGMSKEEYDEKVRLYVNDAQIDGILQDFGEDGADFGVIKAINEMISLIQGMEEKDKVAILNAWNNDLAQEFTEQGSCIASIRGAFDDIELTIRKMYGRELSESLKENSLPKLGRNGVIKLKGEKFKLLIHGMLNANFAKHEVGKSYISTSLISDKHLGKFGNANIYYGFNNIGSNALGLEGNCNIFSRIEDNSTKITGACGVRFETADKLINSTKAYNELVLWREYVGDNGEMREVTPNYIVCFDRITAEDRAESKRLKIPIVLIDSKAYARETVMEQEQIEQTEVEMPVQYGETKSKMIDVIRQASTNCPAVAQQDAMQRIVNYMEREMANEKQTIEH